MKKASHKNDAIGFGEYKELDQACILCSDSNLDHSVSTVFPRMERARSISFK